MKTALAYIRVSSDSQESNTSLENQKHSIITYAINNGITILNWFRDVDSGASESRVGLSNLRNRLKQQDFNFVFVYKVDRFTRSVLLGSTVEQEIKDNNATLVSVSEAFDVNTPSGKFMFNMMQAMAEYEKDTINSRLKMGKMNRITKNGGWLGGVPPFGYKAIGSRSRPSNGELIIDEQASEAIKICFKLREENHSYQEIANKLNIQGFKTSQGCEFNKATVFRILKRKEVYAGNQAINHSFKLSSKPQQPKLF